MRTFIIIFMGLFPAALLQRVSLRFWMNSLQPMRLQKETGRRVFCGLVQGT